MVDREGRRTTETDPASEIASAISGKTYNFPRNALAFRSMTLVLTPPVPYLSWVADQAAPPNGVVRVDGPIGLDGMYRTNAPKVRLVLFAYRA